MLVQHAILYRWHGISIDADGILRSADLLLPSCGECITDHPSMLGTHGTKMALEQ